MFFGRSQNTDFASHAESNKSPQLFTTYTVLFRPSNSFCVFCTPFHIISLLLKTHTVLFRPSNIFFVCFPLHFILFIDFICSIIFLVIFFNYSICCFIGSFVCLNFIFYSWFDNLQNPFIQMSNIVISLLLFCSERPNPHNLRTWL